MMTPEQQALLNKAREISSRFQKWAEEANDHGATVLAREYDHDGKTLTHAIELQVRAFEGRGVPPSWNEQAPEIQKEAKERTLDFNENA